MTRLFQISFILITLGLILTIGYNAIHSRWFSFANTMIAILAPVCLFFAADLTVHKKLFFWKCLYGVFLLITLMMATMFAVTLFNARLNLPFSLVPIYLASVILPFYFSHKLATSSPLDTSNAVKPIKRLVLIGYLLVIVAIIAVHVVPLIIIGSGF